MIPKIILSIFILLINPLLLGLLFTKFMKEKNNLLGAFVIGYLVEFASFELIYLPMYFSDCSFKALQYVYSGAILILTIASIIVNRKRFKGLFAINFKILKDMPNVILVFVILLIIQIYVPVRYMHTDLDDSYYVATTTTTIETNTIFKFDSYTGDTEYSKRPLRYSLSGLTIYFATLSEILDIHPTILQHTIWPAVAVVLEFSVYALIGNKLFKRDKEKLSYFLVFLSVTYVFGFISLYTNFTFFGYRSWQGKALIANFIIPLVWLCYMYCAENNKIVYWLIFLATMISSIFVTCMGAFLVPIQVGVMSLISFVQDRKFLKFLKPIACCLPQVIVGIIYLIS